MINIKPYLLVSDGKKAISLYKHIFNAKLLTHQPFTKEIAEQMGYSTKESLDDTTMHASLDIGGSIIDIADNNQKTQDYGHVEITMELESENQIKDFYRKAMENGSKAKMELTQNEWGWYARIEDKFGVVWQLNYVPSKEK